MSGPLVFMINRPFLPIRDASGLLIMGRGRR